MKVQFNKATWYSKMAAIVLLLGGLPILTFYMGMQFGETIAAGDDVPVYVQAEAQNPGTELRAPEAASPENLKYFTSVKPVVDNAHGGTFSNVVGYFGFGNFYFYVPAWIVENWKTTDLPQGGLRFSPKESVRYKDFSDISISMASTTEFINAATMYEEETYGSNKGTACITDTRCEVRDPSSPIITSEIILGAIGDTRIYHIARATTQGTIEDWFFIDGKDLTATISFSANKNVYYVYESKIREFVQGIGRADVRG